MRKISAPERWVLGAAAGFLLFLGGWTLANTRSDAPYVVTTQRNDPEIAVSSEESGAPDSLLPGERIDVNTAGVYDLRRLPGIGGKKAQAIVDERTANGPFAAAEDLLRVPGIGEKTLENLRDYVRTGGEQEETEHG